jgi:hypothetical protein
MVRASFRVVSDELVAPDSVVAGGRVELAGADIIYDHFNGAFAFAKGNSPLRLKVIIPAARNPTGYGR